MQIKTLSQTHPDYDAEQIRDHDALYVGGRAWHSRVDRFVPQNAQEPPELWEERKKRATYENNAGPIVGLITAWLFSEPATLGGGLEDFAADVDARGTAWSTWWADLFTSAQVARRAYAWVNLPARPAEMVVQSRADEERAGLLRAYLVALDAESVIDWRDDAAGNLAWLMVRSCHSERPSVEAERSRVWRWRSIDATHIRTWEWRESKGKPTPADTDEATELPLIAHGFGRLPVVRLELKPGLWTMGKLEDPVRAHIHADCDYQWSLHRAAHALMVLATKDSTQVPTLGAGYYLQVTRDGDGEDTVTYAEPSGASFDAQAKQVDSKREAIYRVVQQMALSASQDAAPTKLSGASKAMDWQALQVMLAAYSDVLTTAMGAVAEIVGGILGKTPELGGLEGWQQEDLSALLDQATLALPSVPSPTFKRELAKMLARRMLPDLAPAVVKAIDSELDAAEFADPAPYQPPPRPGTGAGGAGA